MPYSRDTYKYIIDTIFAHVSFQNINILELGCGSGSFTRFLSERGNATITAVDISDNLLAIAKQKAKEVYFVQGYINHDFLTGLSLHKYDLILSFCFLHHLSKEARTDIAACLLKYMKKNAVFACFEPNRDNPSILFQYLYETKLNKKDYDSTEFPLSKYELDELFPSKQVDTYYMDVVYASPQIGRASCRERVYIAV
ncbi:MAG: class I SAM-dependent methyltransferase [Prevotella sp.]|nr:class I SAM-dependent methyltransferase [Prevotella sp.]